MTKTTVYVATAITEDATFMVLGVCLQQADAQELVHENMEAAVGHVVPWDEADCEGTWYAEDVDAEVAWTIETSLLS